jgi:hypothetical protein
MYRFKSCPGHQAITGFVPLLLCPGDPTRGMVRRMDQPKATRLVRIAAYVMAIVVGLLAVIGAALVLDSRDSEPGQLVVLLVMGAAALVSIFLGRVTYRAVSGPIDDTPNPPD